MASFILLNGVLNFNLQFLLRIICSFVTLRLLFIFYLHLCLSLIRELVIIIKHSVFMAA